MFAQALVPRAFDISVRVAFSASLTCTPPMPRKPPSDGDGRLAKPRHFLQAFLRRVQRLGEGAELGEDGFGERLGVAARHRAEQDQLKELVVGKRIGAGFAEAPPQPLAMAEIVGLAAASLKPIRGRTIAE